MFRTLGLRHLCVINKYNQVLGVVTRADLVSEREGEGGRERERRREGGREGGRRSRCSLYLILSYFILSCLDLQVAPRLRYLFYFPTHDT